MTARSGWWRDGLLAGLLGIAAAAACFVAQQPLGSMVTEPTMDDAWFSMDIKDFFSMMTSRLASHGDTKVHPLFSLIVYSAVKVLRVTGGLSALTAVQVVLASTAALWSVGMFAFLRLIGCRRLDSVLLSLLAMISAAAMFGFVVPESFPFGTLSIVLALCFVAVGQRHVLHPAWYLLTSAATLSMTVTNWMVGVLAAFVHLPRRQAFQLTVNAFCLVVILWAVQKAIFPSAGFFLQDPKKSHFILHPGAGGPLAVTKSFLFHSMVMPTFEESVWHKDGRLGIRTQHMAVGSGTPLGPVAVGLWAALLILGGWAIGTMTGQREVRTVVGLALLGQLALHLVYGSETFLYALHFAPLLVILAAFGTLTRARRLTLVLASALVIVAGTNNFLQFQKATAIVVSWMAQQEQATHGG